MNMVDYLVIDFIPISNEKREISRRVREREGNGGPGEDFDGSKGTSSLVESKRREIEEASNLVFDLEFVGEVLPRRDGACGSINSVFVRILSLLNSVPIRVSNISTVVC